MKQFLVQYCEQREQDGYFMLQDPLLIFYETLCIGLNSVDDSLDTDDFLQPSPTDPGEFEGLISLVFYFFSYIYIYIYITLHTFSSSQEKKNIVEDHEPLIG